MPVGILCMKWINFFLGTMIGRIEKTVKLSPMFCGSDEIETMYTYMHYTSTPVTEKLCKLHIYVYTYMYNTIYTHDVNVNVCIDA